MTWDHSKLAREMDIYDVVGKVVVIRVEDPISYSASGDILGKELKKRGAAMVLIARPQDKLELLLSDDMLASMGLQRIKKRIKKSSIIV